MIVVNLFGAPGSGKSTGAARIFSILKMAGINAELVTEYAKDKFWEENKGVFKDQLYIFAKQNFKISRLKDKVDVVVTDSPILLSILYNETYSNTFVKLVKEVFDNSTNLNFYLNRVNPYDTNGRFQNEKESQELSKRLKNILNEQNINYEEYEGNLRGYDSIAYKIIQYLKNNKQNEEQ